MANLYDISTFADPLKALRRQLAVTADLQKILNATLMCDSPISKHLAGLPVLGAKTTSSRVFDGVEEKVLDLRSQLRVMTERASRAELQSEERAALNEEMFAKCEELRLEAQLHSILKRTTPCAHSRIRDDEDFRNSLVSGPIKAFVMSIDLRRSTELMLKARSPLLFAEFLQAVASSLSNTVMEEFGVFDKFTGDGILAFFPIEFSGVDAGYRAICAAARCHVEFADLYIKHRKCFDVILKDIGLGIGIDYGTVNITTIGDLTVVGTPVVYACRLGAAPAGHTYLNQTAYEEVCDKYDQNLLFEETSLEFKHEGAMVAYDVVKSHVDRVASKPDWLTKPVVAEDTTSKDVLIPSENAVPSSDGTARSLE